MPCSAEVALFCARSCAWCAKSCSVLALALGVHSCAAVPRPAASSLMPLRCAHQAPGLRSGMVCSHTVDRQPLRKSSVLVWLEHGGGSPTAPQEQRAGLVGAQRWITDPFARARRCYAHQAPELRQCMVGSATVNRPPYSREQVGGVLSAAASRRRQRP